MIRSFLDNDMYKFTIQQCIVNQYPEAFATYKFINRGGQTFSDSVVSRIKSSIDQMSHIYMTDAEYSYIKNIKNFSPSYREFLKSYRYNPEEVKVQGGNGNLAIEISGPWYRSVLWEVPLMAIISEAWHEENSPAVNTFVRNDLIEAIERSIYEKVIALSDIGADFVDFGTRRRFSFDVHNVIAERIASFNNYSNHKYGYSHCKGSSNLNICRVYGLNPVGTVAHEFVQAHAAMNGYVNANKSAMDSWVRQYRGELGIALPDTFTTPVFLRDFDSYYARVYDGVRQDSGDPITFAKMFIEHYERLGIDPMSKRIVFSDSLNVDKIRQIHEFCKGKIRASYGIGTNFTCDVPNVKPLNIVIKLDSLALSCFKYSIPVVKLSDDKGKNTGNIHEISRCIEAFRN